MIDPSITAIAAARLFERLGIPYVLGGSVASSLLGEMRTTQDVDFAVQLTLERARSFVASASDAFFVDVESVEQAVRACRMFNMIHKTEFVKVDVHVVPCSGLNQSEIDRARWMRLPPTGEELRVATAEDVVLQKLIWFDRGGRQSERQWRDVVGVLKVRQNARDHGYVRKWARSENVLDLYERALLESGRT